MVQSARELPPPIFASLANFTPASKLSWGENSQKNLIAGYGKLPFWCPFILWKRHFMKLAWGEGEWGLGVYLAGVGRLTYFVPFFLS